MFLIDLSLLYQKIIQIRFEYLSFSKYSDPKLSFRTISYELKNQISQQLQIVITKMKTHSDRQVVTLYKNKSLFS